LEEKTEVTDGKQASSTQKVQQQQQQQKSMPVEELWKDGVPPFNTSAINASVEVLKTNVVLFKVQQMRIA
jgi:hypothetical protein